MTDDEFRELLDRHGGDLERWPRLKLRDARQLLARSVAAQAMLDEMVAIELALSDPADAPPPGLADRIFEQAFGKGMKDAGAQDATAAPRRLM
ncbi:hypothetical protein [Azospirillum canadense]|uniref:hypothetical protein n=1 Tax=Azospirillum canadense TaxID=403962 RepID=UPI002226D326|nr:hypothetical protein [Azospirillum canadense]MCW2239751.1 hypothetical protein [Azospirillum canadense]